MIEHFVYGICQHIYVIHFIESVYCYLNNALYRIDKDRVIVGGNYSFCLVNIDKCVIEKIINVKSIEYVCCFLKLRDNKTILCGCDNGLFCFNDMKKKNVE